MYNHQQMLTDIEQQHNSQQTVAKLTLSLTLMAKMSKYLKGTLTERCTEPTNTEQIHDAHSADKRNPPSSPPQRDAKVANQVSPSKSSF